MRKAERILKKCNEYHNMVSLALGPAPHALPPRPIPHALPAHVPTPTPHALAPHVPVVEHAPIGGKPRALPAGEFRSVAPGESIVRRAPSELAPFEGTLVDESPRRVEYEVVDTGARANEPEARANEPRANEPRIRVNFDDLPEAENTTEGKERVRTRERGPRKTRLDSTEEQSRQSDEEQGTREQSRSGPAPIEVEFEDIPELKSGYKYRVKRIPKGRRINLRGEPVVAEDGAVTVYVEEMGGGKLKIRYDLLPEEVNNKLNAEITGESTERAMGDLIAKEIKSSLKSHTKANWRGKFRTGDLSEKIQATKEVLRAHPAQLAGITAGGIGAIMILGGIYSLITKKEPSAKSEPGQKLKEGAKASIGDIDSSQLVSNQQLAEEVGNVSTLASRKLESFTNPANKQTLQKMITLLNTIKIELVLESLDLDDPTSAQNTAGKLSKLNSSINEIFKENYLERFAKYLASKNDTLGVDLVRSCETNLANYRSALTESNSAAQSTKRLSL